MENMLALQSHSEREDLGDRDCSSSAAQQSTGPSNSGRSRITKRKASPEKKVNNKQIRVTELVDPHCSSDEDCIFVGELRKVQGDGQEPSTKRGHLEFMQNDEVHSDCSSSAAQQSTGPSNSGRSRITKWKASPEKTVKNKRIRVIELADPYCSSDEDCIFVGEVKKAQGDGQEPSTKTGHLKFMQNDKVQASSSMDTCTDCSSSAAQQSTGPSNSGRSRITKRKASPEKTVKNKRIRVTELADPYCSSDEDCIFVGEVKKAQGDGQEPSTKRGHLIFMQNDEVQASSSVDTCTESKNNSPEGCSYTEQAVSMRKDNRKAAGNGQGPTSKKRTSLDQVETKDHLSVAAQRAQFEAKYMEQELLGEGGFGCVYAGYRKEDHFPVAIKHISEANVHCKLKNEQGKMLPSEVVVMSKLAAGTAGSVESSSPVSLLDWYDLNEELILVMERPVPSMDLYQYTEVNGDRLPEEMAKIIMKQLVKAAKELENKNIFHRDIKLENILTETGSDVPRVRLIDFGLSCFADHQTLFRVFYGTSAHTPPEFYDRSSYRSGPSTVWQLGVVLYEVLYDDFETRRFLKRRLKRNRNLSESCQDFLKRCLTVNPEQRPKLEELLLHPWLQ